MSKYFYLTHFLLIPIMLIILSGCSPSLQSSDYLERKQAVNSSNLDQSIVVKIAIEDKSPDVRKAAISKIEDKNTLSRIAIEEMDYTVVDSVLSKFADDNLLLEKIANSAKNETIRKEAATLALFNAIERKDMSAVKSILPNANLQKNKEFRDKNGATTHISEFTPLNRAIYNGSIEIIEYMLSNGVGINNADERGFRPIHRAVLTGNPKIVSLILAKGADPNQQKYSYKHKYGSINGEAPLHLVAGKIYVSTNSSKHEEEIENYLQIAEILIAAGADVNATAEIEFSHSEKTLPTDAVTINGAVLVRKNSFFQKSSPGSNSDFEAIRYVYEKADGTPMDAAKGHGNFRLVEILKKHGGK